LPTGSSKARKTRTCRGSGYQGPDGDGIEYLETVDGWRVFYDVNANSNLRLSVAAAFGFDPFERVVDFLIAQLGRRRD